MKLDAVVVAACMAACCCTAFANDAPPVVPTHASRSAWADFSVSLRTALIASDRPRDWMLAASMFVFEDEVGALPHASADELRERAVRAAPADVLVQWMAASNRFDRNGALVMRIVPDENIQALIRLEPDNAAIWMMDLALASARGDANRADEALQGMASAVRFDDHFVDTVHAWLDVYDRHPPPTAAMRDMQFPPDDAAAQSVAVATAAFAQASAATMPAYQALPNACRPGTRNGDNWHRHGYCVDAARLMLARGRTLIARSIGFVVLRNFDEATAEDRQQRRDIEWYLYAGGEATIAMFERSDFADAAKYFSDWRDLDDEFEVIRRVLHRSGLPPVAPGFWAVPTRAVARSAATN